MSLHARRHDTLPEGGSVALTAPSGAPAAARSSGPGSSAPWGQLLAVVLGACPEPRPARSDPGTIGGMTSPAVHRTADPPIPVEVDDNGGTWPGSVLGWRGDRVYVTYNTEVGLKHLCWLPAERVRRLPAG